MRVAVYWNSTKRNYSIKYKGKVILRSENCYLKDCELKVSQIGRQNVLSRKRKSVHAYVIGEICDSISIPKQNKFFYNPYTVAQFCNVHTGESILNAKYVFLSTKDKKAICYYRKE